MNGRTAFLDSSAVIKLVVSEPESRALRRFLTSWPERCSSALVRTEVIRALRRAGYDARISAARRLIGRLRLVRVDEPILDLAAELDPRDMRSLDALHLGAALAVAADIGVFVAYDRRLAAAAQLRGLSVVSPA